MIKILSEEVRFKKGILGKGDNMSKEDVQLCPGKMLVPGPRFKGIEIGMGGWGKRKDWENKLEPECEGFEEISVPFCRKWEAIFE